MKPEEELTDVERTYRQLITFLNNEGVRLTKDEFKAVLSAMQHMLIWDTTKKDSIKVASKQNGVSQTTIKKWIDKMGIKSERQQKVQREFAYYQGMNNQPYEERIKRETK